MFYRANHTVHSDLISHSCVRHGFATRRGGVSEIPAVASMNTAVRMGDTHENVAENIARFADYAGLTGYPVVYSHQIHSTNVITVTSDTVSVDPDTRECDGYVTDCRGIGLLVKAADCLPILFSGEKDDGSPVIAATHAGWKGTVGGIAAVAVKKMCSLGTSKDTIRIAVGPSIQDCCFEVKEDFIDSVTAVRGEAFANRHIHLREGRYFASLQDMTIEILEDAGISRCNIDICPDCTAHMSDVYHSHRATGGKRGTGGGIIGII